jgi:FkbM family methyltransferase
MIGQLRRFPIWALNKTPGGIAARLRGDSPLAQLIRPLVNRTLPGGETEVVVRSGLAAGVRLLIDAQAEKYYWSGTHEQHVLDAVGRAVGRGAVVWDVGAHIGYFGITVARSIQPGTVVCFEPMEQNRRRLTHNVATNGVSATVEIVPAAVGATSGRAMIRDTGSSLTWSLTGGGNGAGVEVDVISLDDAAERYPVPDLIKIDAEGVEMDVLLGGSALIAKHQPMVLVELMERSQAQELQARALMPGYDFSHLGDNHWLLVAQQGSAG